MHGIREYILNEVDASPLRAIVIDDNPEIYEDFKKILSTDYNCDLEKIRSQIFAHESEKNIKTEYNGQDHELPLFELTMAVQGSEGIKKIKTGLENNQPFAIAFIDIRMPPGIDGVSTVKEVMNIDPNIQIVIASAYTDYNWSDIIFHLGARHNLLVIQKPFSDITIKQIACALGNKWKLEKANREYEDILNATLESRTTLLHDTLKNKSTDTLESRIRDLEDENDKYKKMFQRLKEEIKRIEMIGRPQHIDKNRYKHDGDL